MPRTCWAEVLGNCEGGISEEHLVSANLFDGPLITVSGFPWQIGPTQQIPVSRFTANVLCRFHNSALSPVDVAGGEAFRLLREIVERWREVLTSGADPPQPVADYEVDGIMLERWFAKCTANLTRLANVDAPPPELVRYIFGLDGGLPPPRGLYGAYVLDDLVLTPGWVKFAPLVSNEGGLIAALFGLHNFRFALWFFGDPPRLEVIEHSPDWRISHLVRHPSAMEFLVRGEVWSRVRFRWGS